MEKHFFYSADDFLSRGEKRTKSEDTSAWHTWQVNAKQKCLLTSYVFRNW